MKTFLLRLLPYFISVFCGGIIFVLTESHISHEGMRGLTIGIASGLLSIPLVFICYETVNHACNLSVRKALLRHMTFEIDAALIDVLVQVKKIVQHNEPLTKDSLQALLQLEAAQIRQQLSLSPAVVPALRYAQDELLHTVQKHSHAHPDLLPAAQMETLLSIRKEASTIARELLHQNELPPAAQDSRFLVENIAALLHHIGSWIDLCEQEALVNHEHFRFLSEK